MIPTVGGIPIVLGQTYYTLLGDIPRIVTDLDGSTVWVRNPNGATEWPVKNFARYYYRKATA